MKEKMVTGKERGSYGLYFLGQNIFYMLVFGYMNTYFTDAGIPAVTVAGIALVVKIWDAVNDPIFGAIMDKVKFKKGKFVPWLRISLFGIPLATIMMFAIPGGAAPGVKVAWAVVAYILWDSAYTLCDVPIYGLVTTITNIQEERTGLNALARICATIASVGVMITIPVFRNKIGGWTATVILLSVIGIVTMIPICITAKERVAPSPEDKEPDVGLKDMFRYLKTNKYLMIFYAGYMIAGAVNIDKVCGLYVARHCLGNESLQAMTSMISLVPMLILGVLVPKICQKVDKFKIYRMAIAGIMIMNVVRYFVGYHNLTAYMVVMALSAIPTGCYNVLMFMFAPDCAEYGHYKTGNSLPGITFATQSFAIKLQAALVTAIGSFMLAVIGFVEGEGAVQAVGFSDRLWTLSCLLPAAGIAVQLLILRAYKLNDHDVQLMAKCNTGEITHEEAERQMINQY